ncbi:MAG: ABC transporter ATP-binding protein [Proteobacteria bacterium]|nr:ABC transporter ATP-binding protein [Pseudomonadota bacterium]
MNRSKNISLLTVEDLSLGIKSTGCPAVCLVENINFSLEPGMILGIAGESGSGKTLTASALSGLLPEPVRILSGKMRFAGGPLFPEKTKHPGFKRGQDILFLFQSPSSALDPRVRVGIQISDALVQAFGWDRKTGRKQTCQAMEQVGLSASFFDRYPFQLSGGQRQRVLMAMAFGLRPQILIADEPTAGQDDSNRDHLLMLLREYTRTRLSSAIVISHDLGVLCGLADFLLIFFQGQQVEAGTPAQILAGQGHAHTRELVDAMGFFQEAP